MIITVNTRGAKVKALETCLIEEDSKKSSYRIEPSNLNNSLKYIYQETGIWKVEVIVEDSSELGINKETVKETAFQYLERITSKHLYILKKEKDVKKFLKAIGYKDGSDTLYEIYRVMVNEKNIKKIYDSYYFGKRSVYRLVLNHFFDKEKIENLKEDIAVWCKKYCKERDRSINYTAFIKLLLKHTSHKYYY